MKKSSTLASTPPATPTDGEPSTPATPQPLPRLASPEASPFSEQQPFGQAIWQIIASIDVPRVERDRALVRGWAADQRWPFVEADYQEAHESLQKLADLGPKHAQLASYFNEHAPSQFLMALGNRLDPLSTFNETSTLQAIVDGGLREQSFNSWLDRLELSYRSGVGIFEEADYEQVEALILEGAQIDSATYQAELVKFSKELRRKYNQAQRLLPNVGAQPPLRFTNSFFNPMSYLTVGGEVRTKPGGGDYVLIRLRTLHLSRLYARHRAVEGVAATWDPCTQAKAWKMDPDRIIVHELIHALSSDHGYFAWTGQGGQLYLGPAKARSEKNLLKTTTRFHRCGVTYLPLPPRAYQRGQAIVNFPVLNLVNEALTEAATLDFLGLPDPDPEKPPSDPSGYNAYYKGVGFVRNLLAGVSPLELLLLPEPLLRLVDLVNQRMSGPGASHLLDLIFEKSESFVERGGFQAQMSSVRHPDIFSAVYQMLTVYLAADDGGENNEEESWDNEEENWDDAGDVDLEEVQPHDEVIEDFS
jgi:hypothetical protein